VHSCAAVTAGGLLALLEENDNTLRTHALTKLADVVDQYWAEVSSAVPLIEELSEDPSFPARELAASVASKCFFHLEEYNDALRLALGAGKHFDVSAKTEYVSTLVSRCIDEYIALRTQSEEVDFR
jgi:26S proteasome regulatory subunit N2